MRLLLDAHMSAAVARQLRHHGVDAITLAEWQGGNHRTAPDDQLLAAAESDSRVLVTFDCQTIPPLLREWAETGLHHAGVILIDEKTIRQSDVGGQVRALGALVERHGSEDWRDRVVFLQAR